MLIILLLPVIAMTLVGLTPKKYRLGWLATFLLLLGFLISCCCLLATYQGAIFHTSSCWFEIPSQQTTQTFYWGIYIDFIAALMLCVVSLLSFWVFLYTIPYFQAQAANKRIFVLLSLFVSAMLWLVIADNLIGMFIGWEVMSFASYLLIGFWCQQTKAAQASTKAWLVSKLGSVLLLVGFLLIGKELGSFTLPFTPVIKPILLTTKPWLTVAGLCIVGGVFTKSAQFPFFNWLPSAMTAPIPASALLHAATLVSAGIYVLIRVHPILPANIHLLIAYTGAITAFMGAYAALTQPDIKRMLAYSTLSQLGYVVMAIGIQATGAGLFHLIVHGFAKACLFLCAGGIGFFLKHNNLANNNMQAMPMMGGLARTMPIIGGAYGMASLSIIGLYGFTGFVSKEAILGHTLHWAMHQFQAGHYLGCLVPTLAFLTSLLTLCYLVNSWWLIFMGIPRWKGFTKQSKKPFKALAIPLPMQVSIMALGVCSLSLPYNYLSGFLQSLELALSSAANTLALPDSIQHTTTMLGLALLLLGLLILCLTRQYIPTKLSSHFPQLTNLSLQGWYLDALTSLAAKHLLALSHVMVKLDQMFIQKPIQYVAIGYVTISHLIAWIDSYLVGGITQGIGLFFQGLSRLYAYLQTGNLQRYFWWTYIGSALIVAWWIYRTLCLG